MSWFYVILIIAFPGETEVHMGNSVISGRFFLENKIFLF